MLSSRERLRAAEDFRRCITHGVKAGGPCIVMYGHRDGRDFQAGYVVSKQVGNAVVRNRTKRRLRHLTRALQADSPMPSGSFVVVRALPPAATTSELDVEFRRGWDRLRRRLESV